MSESPTGEAAQNTDGLNNEPTEQLEQNTPAESQNQEANSNEQSQEAASDDSSAQNNENKNNESGAPVTDDGLANFAKSQGIDLETATDTEKRLLKIARDNQSAARSNQPKVNEVAKDLGTPPADATEVQKLHSKVQQMEYDGQTKEFWSGENRNRELEPTMVEILRDKEKQFGKEFAFNLSRDLDTLYSMAQIKSGSYDPSTAKEEGRREATTSIKKALAAGAPQAHAVNSGASNTPQVTSEWIANEYDPNNPDHRKLVDAAARSGLY